MSAKLPWQRGWFCPTCSVEIHDDCIHGFRDAWHTMPGALHVTHDVIRVFEPLPVDKREEREETAPPEDDDVLHIVDIDGTDRLVLSWDRGEPYGDGIGAEVHCFRNATTGGWLARGSLVPCGIGDAVLAVVYE